jgi:2-dehydro-3-deoxygluconokinase
MKKVLTFGEALLRLSPQPGGEWIKRNSLPVFIGGAELNVAIALAKFDLPVFYCTTLPDNYLSKELIEFIQQQKIDVSKIFFSGNRIGIYYLPEGTDLKNAGVIYDRRYSSFWELKPGQLNWDQILEDVHWFHFSAINMALNDNLAAVCKEGAAAAFKKNIRVSVDLNYRSTLWQYGKQPFEVMPELVQYCDVIMGNIWAVEKMLGIPVVANLKDSKEAYLKQSLKTAEQICKRYSNCSQIANTFRFDIKKGIHYYATLYTGGMQYVSKEFHSTHFIDKVGSGDTFMAALIYGIHKQLMPREIIDFATAAAFNKLFIKGDSSTASVKEIREKCLNDA